MPDYIVYWKTVSCGQFLMKNFLNSTWAFLKKKIPLKMANVDESRSVVREVFRMVS